MSPVRPASGSTLRKRVLGASAVTAALIVGGVLLLLNGTHRARVDLSAAMDSFVEEQHIADRITRAVMRQLASVSAFRAGPVRERMGEFQAAGEEVTDQIRRYLFRELSIEERLQVEAMREEHQRMAVAAARTAELLLRGEGEAAETVRETAVGHVFDFLEAVEAFLAMREAHMEALRARQEATFLYLYAGGGSAAGLAVIGLLILAWILQRRVARPLEELGWAAERIGGGDLEARAPPFADREFQLLASAFNRMAENLEAAASDLERRNEQLTDALERVRATQDELIQSEKLTAMGRMTAGLAHELNNPLASVLGYTELLSTHLTETDRSSSSEIREEFVRPILQEATRAQHLVRHFLLFSRGSQAELGPVSVRKVVDTVVELRGQAFERAGLGLEVEEVPDLHVLAESQMLQGVFLNLLNNAFDAMRPANSGTLRVRVTPTSRDRVEIAFEDDGPGLPHLDRIFEPFFTTKPVGEGTGLGLALVHRFVTGFGGSVRAWNRPEGGACFLIGLRTVEPGTRPPEEPAETGAGRQEEDGREAGSSDQLECFVRLLPGEGPRILVVEDEAHLRSLQRRILARLNARVIVAPDAGDARRILAEQEIDVVISDVKMPGENGLDFYRWLEEAHPALADRFLFVTGDVSAPELVALAEERPDLFLHKPFRVADYLARVREVVG
jgi:signal transduction histidine kinase